MNNNSDTIFRNGFNHLSEWLIQENRKPLILRGARQVGKSTLVRKFCEREKLQLIEVNLEEHGYLNKIFGTFNIDNIIAEISSLLKIKFSEKTLLFLDEVQACPNALACLRYFYENKPFLPIITAGSLLEFLLADHSFSMPVGRIDYYFLYPLTFSEYLMAKNLTEELQIIQEYALGKIKYLPETTHKVLLKTLAEYTIVGGMPEATKKFLKNRNYLDVMSTYQRLFLTYRNDFAKYSKKVSYDTMQDILNNIPNIVGNTKVKYSSLSPGVKTEANKKALNYIIQAGIIHKITHVNCNGLPLSASEDKDIFKIIGLDTAMFFGKMFKNSFNEGLLNKLYEKWEQGSIFETKWLSQTSENLVGQSLIAQHNDEPKLHYWLREGKSANAEIDYIIQHDFNIIPIEVKAGASGSLKSLHTFMAEKSFKYALRFDINLPSEQDIHIKSVVSKGELKEASYKLFNLPLYFADFIYDFLKNRIE